MGNRTRIIFMTTTLAIAVFIVSCGATKSNTPKLRTIAAVDEDAINPKVNPCQDFYSYACGKWEEKTAIPPGYSRWAKSFNVIADENLNTLKTVLDKYAANDFSLAVANGKKLGDFYATCMEWPKVPKAQNDLLNQTLAEIDSIKSKDDFIAALPKWHNRGVNALFNYYASQDAKNATAVIAHIDRGGMGLPDREYYLDPSPAKVTIRQKYVDHISKILILAGAEVHAAKDQANGILALETVLAQNSLKREDRRDPEKVYHLIGTSGLKSLADSVPWNRYLEATVLGDAKNLNVVETEFFKGVAAIFTASALPDLKNYLRWQAIHSMAPFLSQQFFDEDFGFYGKTLSGKKAPLPRWKYCINATSKSMGEALGEAYVKLKFGEEGKAEAQKLITNLRKSVEENLNQLPWMDESTRTKAQEKLTRIFAKMGYPDKFRDYTDLKISRNSLLENELSAREFDSRRNLAKIGKPVDRNEWEMNPHEVNAYYNPNLNEIVFPAGILQLPFFSAKAPLSGNYGAIGAVIGHEITHGFDDEGRQFDADGNLHNWWSEASTKAFESRTACLVKQYDGYTVAGGVHLNGKLTLGENIADLGGVKISYAAFQKAKAEKPRTLTGLTEDQQFFVAFAQVWCNKATPEEEKLRAATDPHANPRYRVNGVVPNLPQFQTAFGCPTGQPMAPKDRCSVW